MSARGAASRLAATLAVAAIAGAGNAAGGTPTHDQAFWTGLRAQQFHVPAGEPVLPLALEATRLLGATDPAIRDSIGYEALATWIYEERRLDGGELGRLRAVLVANARDGLGEPAGDGLFLRSFSTLALALIAADDLRNPSLDQSGFDELLELGLDALARERDLRGWVPGKGWGHATAHAADLLKFLGRSPRLRPAQQTRIVAAIATRLGSAGQVFVWGEDGRLAAALAALARRADADPAPFEAWFRRLAEAHAAVWHGDFDPAGYTSVRAPLNALAELAADLEPDTMPGGTQAIRAALRALRAATR
jgi:hypothetical protein